jgi:hypothetical protein
MMKSQTIHNFYQLAAAISRARFGPPEGAGGFVGNIKILTHFLASGNTTTLRIRADFSIIPESAASDAQFRLANRGQFGMAFCKRNRGPSPVSPRKGPPSSDPF